MASTWPAEGVGWLCLGADFWGERTKERNMGTETKEHGGALRGGCPSNPYPVFIHLLLL